MPIITILCLSVAVIHCDIPKTLHNAYSVSCSAIIVAHSEGEMLKI